MAEIVVYSDVACPWSTVIVLRLLAARSRAGADDAVAFVHRALPLELVHEKPIPRRIVDAEIPLCAALTPEFNWTVWHRRPEEYPVTVIPALEAVQAAASRSLRAGEQLDLALRRALFTESRCISMRHEILAAARTCDAVDVDFLSDALDSGTFRGRVAADYAYATATGVPCSGTIVRANGEMVCNPGTRTGWIGGTFPRGTPVLLADEPAVYDDIVAEALAASAESTVSAALVS
jgi:predicted DsbA family dithiol-disulfide isomerase